MKREKVITGGLSSWSCYVSGFPQALPLLSDGCAQADFDSQPNICGCELPAQQEPGSSSAESQGAANGAAALP